MKTTQRQEIAVKLLWNWSLLKYSKKVFTLQAINKQTKKKKYTDHKQMLQIALNITTSIVSHQHSLLINCE